MKWWDVGPEGVTCRLDLDDGALLRLVIRAWLKGPGGRSELAGMARRTIRELDGMATAMEAQALALPSGDTAREDRQEEAGAEDVGTEPSGERLVQRILEHRYREVECGDHYVEACSCGENLDDPPHVGVDDWERDGHFWRWTEHIREVFRDV